MQTDDRTTDETTEPIDGVNGDQGPQGAAEPDPGLKPDPNPDPPPEPLLAPRRPRKGHEKGHYMVLAGVKDGGGDVRYLELGWTKAHGPDQAKRIALRCPVHGPTLKAQIRDAGVWIRAVPASSWTKTEASRIRTTERLEIG